MEKAWALVYNAVMPSLSAMPLSPDDLRVRLRALPVSFETGEPVAVGVSGGPDSMALAWLLVQAGLSVTLITVDHGLRPEAADEARAVGRHIAGWPRVRHEILTREAPEGGARIMETARADRYRMMEECCIRHGIRFLFVAHHMDDQSETVLFRLAKGSGLDGLGGMRPFTVLPSGVALCRPLLDVPGARLRATCLARNVPFIDDPSNVNPDYARPRLREAAAVLAAEGMTPERLARLASRMSRAGEALVFFCEQVEAQARKISDCGRIVFIYSALKSQPAEIRFRILQRAVLSLRADENASSYGPRMLALEALEADLFSPAPQRRSTLAGCLFTVSLKDDTIGIAREAGAPRL